MQVKMDKDSILVLIRELTYALENAAKFSAQVESVRGKNGKVCISTDIFGNVLIESSEWK